MRLAAIAIASLVGASTTASAEPDLIAGAGGGVLYVDKQAATPVTGLSGTAEVSLGVRVHPRSLVKARVFGFRADGKNLVVALGGELDLLGSYAGVTAGAGFSMGSRSRGGNFASIGAFARAPATNVVAFRLDVAASMVVRNDFSGVGASGLLGVEVSWDR